VGVLLPPPATTAPDEDAAVGDGANAAILVSSWLANSYRLVVLRKLLGITTDGLTSELSPEL
jgi:hypothetical protein